jgi:hypothetical protein
METFVEKPIWQLLVADPSSLTCEQCFAVIEYYIDTLGSDHGTLLPVIEKYLRHCPDCVIAQHLALYQKMVRRGVKPGVPHRETGHQPNNGASLYMEPDLTQLSGHDHAELSGPAGSRKGQKR